MDGADAAEEEGSDMVKHAIKFFAAACTLIVLQSPASTAPIAGAGLFGGAEANPLLHDARLVCVNRRTRRIIHYGPCRRRVIVRRYFCKNRYTGRFLYWGRCRR